MNSNVMLCLARSTSLWDHTIQTMTLYLILFRSSEASILGLSLMMHKCISLLSAIDVGSVVLNAAIIVIMS